VDVEHIAVLAHHHPYNCQNKGDHKQKLLAGITQSFDKGIGLGIFGCPEEADSTGDESGQHGPGDCMGEGKARKTSSQALQPGGNHAGAVEKKHLQAFEEEKRHG